MSEVLEKAPRYPAQSRQSSFYAHLREQLLDTIVRAGNPGDRLPPERELAKRFQSSTMTIGRILPEFQAEGLLQRVPGKGTFICEPWQGQTALEPPDAPLLTRKLPAHTAIVVNLSPAPEHQTREFWTHRTASIIERRLQEANIRTTIVDRNAASLDQVGEAVAKLKQAGVDAVLAIENGPVSIKKSPLVAAWNRELHAWKREAGKNLTITQLNFGDHGALPFDNVTFNSPYGTFLATNHLLELGHREIALLTRTIHRNWMQARAEAFVQALQLHGINPEFDSMTEVVAGGPVFSCDGVRPEDSELNEWGWAAREVVNQFFADEAAVQRYTGIVALNDQVAFEFINQARARGFEVPGRFSVVGYDDALPSKAFGLTTLHPPIEELGSAAADLLIQRHQDPLDKSQTEIMLHPTLVVRSSTAAPRDLA